jgi:two-component system, NarL family, invasion response regulator UvrY
MTAPRGQILVVDDHAVVRTGLMTLLNAQPDFEVAAAVGTVAEALVQVRTRAFDLIILDVGLPAKNGWDLLKTLRTLDEPQPPVLILSAQREEEYAVQALRLGAAGYVSKNAAPENLVIAVRRVLGGGRYIGPEIAEHLAGALLTGDSTLQPHEQLAPREFQVLLMIAAGRALVDIASDLNVSPKTVTSWRARILEKLALQNNADLVRYCLQRDLIPS